jgi:hypothetical protein
VQGVLVETDGEQLDDAVAAADRGELAERAAERGPLARGGRGERRRKGGSLNGGSLNGGSLDGGSLRDGVRLNGGRWRRGGREGEQAVAGEGAV